MSHELLYGWTMDRNLDNFITVADNLKKEGHTARAETILYLIERCKRAEQGVQMTRVLSFVAIRGALQGWAETYRKLIDSLPPDKRQHEMKDCLLELLETYKKTIEILEDTK